MELHSPAFYPAVTKALESDVVIFGTVPMPRYGHTIREVEAIKERSDVHLFHLTKSTRDELFEVVYQTLKGILSGNIGTDDILPSNDDMTNSIAAAGLVPNGQSSRRQKPSDSDSKKPMASADDMSSDPIPAPPLVGNVPPKVLLMGNTASPATRSNSFDYAERSWWSMLDYALGINEAASYDSKKEALNHAGIVLWDICPDVHVKGTKSGSNKNSKKRSRSTSYNDIEGFISLHPTVKRVCLNGVGAEKIFSGAFPEFRSKYPSVDVVTLPSSSRANSSMSMEKKRQSWKEALGSR
jgi:hypoxanthine-DNA glycosylase